MSFLPSQWFEGSGESAEFVERLARADRELRELKESGAGLEVIAAAEQEREKWIKKLSRL